MTQDGGTEYHPGEQFTDDCRLPPALHQIREYPACKQQRADLDEKMENLKLAESLQPSTAGELTRRARRFTRAYHDARRAIDVFLNPPGKPRPVLWTHAGQGLVQQIGNRFAFLGFV